MENYNDLVQFAPYIVIILVFVFKNKIFVTPAQLEKKHREIMHEAQQNFVSLLAYQEFRQNYEKKSDEMLRAINDLKNYLMNTHK